MNAGGVGGNTAREQTLDREVWEFFGLAFLLSWLAWLPFLLGYGHSLGQLGVLPGAFGPAVSAALVTWRSGRSVRRWVRGLFRWRVHVRWYAVAILAPVATVIVAGVLLGGAGYPVDFGLLGGRTILFLPTLVFMALLGGGQEEAGWRGYALPRLQSQYGPVRATALLGVLWAVWHLPLFGIETVGQHGTSFIAYAGLVLPLTALFTWLNNESRSTLLVILLHGSVNAALGVFIPLPLSSLAGDAFQAVILAVAAVLWVVTFALVFATRGTLGYRADDATDDAIGDGARPAGELKEIDAH